MPAKRAHRFGGPALKKKQATEPAANDEQRHEAAAEEDKEKEKEEEGKEEEKEEKTGSEEADVKKPASGASSGGSGGAKGGREAIDIIFAFDTTSQQHSTHSLPSRLHLILHYHLHPSAYARRMHDISCPRSSPLLLDAVCVVGCCSEHVSLLGRGASQRV